MSESVEPKKESALDPALSAVLKDILARLKSAEEENKDLKKRVEEASSPKKVVANTTIGRQRDGKLTLDEPKPTPIELKDEPAYKGLDWQHDACPFCNESKTKNIVDQTPQGSRYQCRVCAKSWSVWMLGKKYDQDFEGIVSEKDYAERKARSKFMLDVG